MMVPLLPTIEVLERFELRALVGRQGGSDDVELARAAPRRPLFLEVNPLKLTDCLVASEDAIAHHTLIAIDGSPRPGFIVKTSDAPPIRFPGLVRANFRIFGDCQVGFEHRHHLTRSVRGAGATNKRSRTRNRSRSRAVAPSRSGFVCPPEPGGV